MTQEKENSVDLGALLQAAAPRIRLIEKTAERGIHLHFNGPVIIGQPDVAQAVASLLINFLKNST